MNDKAQGEGDKNAGKQQSEGVGETIARDEKVQDAAQKAKEALDSECEELEQSDAEGKKPVMSPAKE